MNVPIAATAARSSSESVGMLPALPSASLRRFRWMPSAGSHSQNTNY